MKKIFAASLILSLAIACAPSPQEKAEALVKEAVQKSLYIPDSYEAVDTQLDSAFTPYHDPAFVATVLDMCKKGVEMDELESKMKSAKSSMSIWSGPYMTSFGRNQYNEAKEEYEEAKEKYDALTAKIQKMAEGLRAQIEKEPEFIGCRVHHRYRAKNNAGNVLMGEAYFLLDKDLTQIIAQWDGEEIEVYNAFLQQASEAAEANQ
jgi:hypothetical protein